MPQRFLRFSEFTEFNESSAPFRENDNISIMTPYAIPVLFCYKQHHCFTQYVFFETYIYLLENFFQRRKNAALFEDDIKNIELPRRPETLYQVR